MRKQGSTMAVSDHQNQDFDHDKAKNVTVCGCAANLKNIANIGQF